MTSIKNELSIYNPIKTSKNIYYSRIMHNSEDISFQAEKNKLVIDKPNNKCSLLLDEKSVECIKKITDAVIEYTSEKSKEWFGKELNLEQCKSICKNNLTENNLTCFYDENSIFYETKNKNLNITDLSDELYGIALIKCDVVVYTKTYFFIKWEINQFKIKSDPTEKEISIYLTEYRIKDLPEHIKSTKDEEIVRKLDTITLF
jgi:hypothetical protein